LKSACYYSFAHLFNQSVCYFFVFVVQVHIINHTIFNVAQAQVLN